MTLWVVLVRLLFRIGSGSLRHFGPATYSRWFPSYEEISAEYPEWGYTSGFT